MISEIYIYLALTLTTKPSVTAENIHVQKIVLPPKAVPPTLFHFSLEIRIG